MMNMLRKSSFFKKQILSSSSHALMHSSSTLRHSSSTPPVPVDWVEKGAVTEEVGVGVRRLQTSEARHDKSRGPLATAIVEAGTLACGQFVVVGAEWGRIRAMRDMMGTSANQATPAMPVEIEGLKGLPEAGDDVTVVHSEERAMMLSEGSKMKLENDRLMKLDAERLEILNLEKDEEAKVEDEGGDAQNEGEGKVGRDGRKDKRREQAKENCSKRPELPIIVKADVQGTAEAVADALKSLNSHHLIQLLPVFVVQTGVGPISLSDVDIAQTCNACIVGFNVRDPPNSIIQEATRTGVKIKLHRNIYHLLEDIGNLFAAHMLTNWSKASHWSILVV